VPPESLGLIDVLENTGVTLGDVILNTNMENLKILPAGKVHAHSTELLASDGMIGLMGELSRRYADRVIVFDSPPLLLTNEAGVLANLMGQIVIVVMADVTPQHAIIEAIEHIAEDKMIGMVLNRTRRNRGKLFGYGYGYGYGYGSDSRGRRAESNAINEA
jgi:Mrp family chromosome partitioning ATPase